MHEGLTTAVAILLGKKVGKKRSRADDVYFVGEIYSL